MCRFYDRLDRRAVADDGGVTAVDFRPEIGDLVSQRIPLQGFANDDQQVVFIERFGQKVDDSKRATARGFPVRRARGQHGDRCFAARAGQGANGFDGFDSFGMILTSSRSLIPNTLTAFSASRHAIRCVVPSSRAMLFPFLLSRSFPTEMTKVAS